MAADFKLNIPITADGRSAVSNLNELADSASKLFRDLVKGKATVKEFDAAMGEDLAVAARKAGEGFKAIEAQYKTITPLFEKARQKFSENKNATEDQRQAYKDLEATYKILKEEVDKKRAADDAEAEAIRKRNEELRKQAEEDQRIIDYLHEMAEAQDEYNAKLKEQSGLSARINTNYDNYINGRILSASAGAAAMPNSVTFDDSNLRFYKQVGNDVAYAQEELKLYEAQLRRVLSAENASPTAVDAATNAYKKQKTMVDNLTKSEAVHVSGLTKLLSVAKNILKFQLLMGPITAAIRGVKDTISDSMQVAAEAEQVFNKLSTVYEGLGESASSAANEIATSLGVAKSTAAGALSTVGDLLQAQGMGIADSLAQASQWVKQFQDIIAFKDLNMSLEEFAQNFMSGAAGNLRNFRTFGSIVKESAVNAELAAQGLDKLTGSQLELAKMTTRANLALKQQENAIGATEREWDSMLSINRRLNEAWKEYKENLGNSLNEFIKPAKSWLAEILDYTNDVTRALKEINGGEFTVKVQQETTDEYLSRVRRVIMSQTPQSTYEEVAKNGMSFWERLSEAVGLASGATVGQIYSSNTLTDRQLRDVMLATGATPQQLIEASAGSGINITEEQAEAAQGLVNEYLDLQEAINEVKTSIMSSGEAFDSFTESIASLAHLNLRSTNLAAVGEGVNEYNYEDIMESFGLNAGNQVSSIISSALTQIKGLGVETFMDGIDLAFNAGDKEQAYKTWLEEIRDLYTILYNREVEVGDVGQDTLDRVIDIWGGVNDELQDYLKGLDDAKKKEDALASAKSFAENYRTQLNNFGLSDYQITLNDILAKEANAQTGAEANSYSDAARDFVNITAKQVAAAFDGMAYAAELATIGMTDHEKELYNLEQEYLTQKALLEGINADTSELDKNYETQRENLIALHDAQDKYNAELERQAALVTQIENSSKIASLKTSFQTDIAPLTATGKYAEAETWRAGQKQDLRSTEQQLLALGANASSVNSWISEMVALIEKEYEARKEYIDLMEQETRDKQWADINNAANPFGSLISTFNSGKDSTGNVGGGIWALILELVKNTESFQTLVSLFKDTFVPILDAILKPLMPVLKMFASFFDNLDWELAFDIMKVIAEILAGTLYIIKAAINTIEAVVKTIYYAITFQWGKINDVWERYTDTLAEDTATMIKTLGQIRDTNFEIVRNTDDEDKDLALLRDLWNRGIIDEQTYYKESGSLQGNYLPTPVAPTYPTARAVSIGNISLTFTGNNPEEIARAVGKVFKQYTGYDFTEAMPMTVGGY